MARKNAVGTVRFTLSVDPTTDSVLQSMVPLGLHGKNKAEVASWVLREWIWHNKQELASAGIQVRVPAGQVLDESGPSPSDRNAHGRGRILTRIQGRE